MVAVKVLDSYKIDYFLAVGNKVDASMFGLLLDL